jgi:hypothetical protein
MRRISLLVAQLLAFSEDLCSAYFGGPVLRQVLLDRCIARTSYAFLLNLQISLAYTCIVSTVEKLIATAVRHILLNIRRPKIYLVIHDEVYVGDVRDF